MQDDLGEDPSVDVSSIQVPRPVLSPPSHVAPVSTPGSSIHDLSSVRYHVVTNTPHDSDCESAVIQLSLQRNVRLPPPASSSDRRAAGGGGSGSGSGRLAEEARRQRIKYRRRRNRIGLLLVFATLLLFAGLVVCANTREYVAGATISVIGVILGSSSMVLCLITTDSCERVHGFRERVSSYSRANRRRNSRDASADNHRRPAPPRRVTDGLSAHSSAANSTLNVHNPLAFQALPPTAVCNISGDFLDHLPPPLYETSEILRREDMAADGSLHGDVSGAVGFSNNFQYYKVGHMDDGGASSDVSHIHMCEDCVQRHQGVGDEGGAGAGDGGNDDIGDGGAGHHHAHAAVTIEQTELLLAPAIVVELPTYDEAVAEDR